MWIPSPTHRESDMEGLAYCSGTMVFINTSSFILQMLPSGKSHFEKKLYPKKTFFSGEKVEVLKISLPFLLA